MKVEIIRCAAHLMDMLNLCEDENFVDEIVNAVYENDVAPLWDLEDRLQDEEDQD